MISSSDRSRVVIAGRIAQPITAGRTRYATRSHPSRVTGPSAALRRHPVDVLRRVLDVAGFAMHAVLRVDAQARLARDLLDFIHPGRTVPGLRTGIELVVDRDRLLRIEQLEMRGLVFFVV